MAWEDFVEDLNVQGIVDDLKSAGQSWMDRHREDIRVVGIEGAEAVLVMAYIETLPSEVLSPDVNIKKMQASAKLLALAARHQKRLDVMRENAKKTVGVAVEKILKHVGGVALKTILGAATMV